MRAALRAAHVGSDLLCAPLLRYAARRLAPAVCTPPHFLYLLFSVEDKRFLLHGGVDPLAMLRAAGANLAGGGALQGASTLTQQLWNIAREQARARRRTLSAKWRQWRWALRHQRRHSKRAVLAAYLERVYWGRSYHGLDEAARGYCATERPCLSVAQSFFLVERLASPNVLRPRRVVTLVRRRCIAPVLRAADRVELLELYQRHFAPSEALRRALQA